jgi:nicotinamide-nucleotide amidase
MAIGILATGDEIVHGDTLDTNSHNIAQVLSSEGIPLGLQMSCSDKEKDIIDCLCFLAEKHDILIIIGGLGPTTDDLTRFALAQFTHDALIQHTEALTHIQNRLQAANVTTNEGNLQQCLFPEKAILLPNPRGTAMGCYYHWKDKIFILLPGPPHECLPMFNNFALPLLQKTQHSNKHILKWRIFGVAESEIGETLETALADLNCQTGYRLDMPYLEFKVRCTSDLIEPVKLIVDPIIAPYAIAAIDKKASEKLCDLILSLNEPINIIDEATGGVLQCLLTKPGTHHLLNFHSMNKRSLFFHLQGLTEYWSGQPASGQTQLTIRYGNQNQEGDETHTIPFRSPSVVSYAAEWLSFRLFHLIKQLHQ